MKLHLYTRFVLVFIAGILWSCQQTPAVSPTTSNTQNAPQTIVYVVRHAEKLTTDPGDQDPGLSPEGEERAKALATYLDGQKVGALYATKYKRTRATLQPLADAHNLTINTYEAHDFETLKRNILQNHAGKTIVVSGHSNTIVPIAEAFGVQKPFAEVPDSKYDHIFKLTIAGDNTATLQTGTYGVATN